MTVYFGPKGRRGRAKHPSTTPSKRSRAVAETAARAQALREIATLLGLTIGSLGYGHPLQTLLLASDGACFLCGGQIARSAHFLRSLTAEHVWPKVKGGTRHRNILGAHRQCNQAKGDRLPYPCELIFLASVLDRLERRP